MNFKILLIIQFVLSVLSGIFCMLLPASMLSNFGVSLSSMGLVIYQFWGAALLGLGIISWVLRNANEVKFQKQIALSFLITHALNTIMAIRGQLFGANDAGWSNVVLFLILAVLFGYFLIRPSRN